MPGRRGPVAGPLVGRGADLRRPAAGGRGGRVPVRRPRRRPPRLPGPRPARAAPRGARRRRRRRPCSPGPAPTCRAEVVDRLVERTGGNPLALLELPGSLAPDQLAGRAPLQDVLPLTTRLERAFGERVRRLPEAARTLLLVAAAETTGDPAVVLRAGARLGVGRPRRSAEAESAGLVRTGDGRLAFRHPLVRSAAYRTATLAARQAAHRALAEVARRRGRSRPAGLAPGRGHGRARRGRRGRAGALGRPGPAPRRARRRRLRAGAVGRAHRRRASCAAGGWPRRRPPPGWPARPAGPLALLDRAEPLATELATAGRVAHLRGVDRGQPRHRPGTPRAMLVAGSELAATVDPARPCRCWSRRARSPATPGTSTPTAELGRRAAALPVAEQRVGEFLSDLLQGIGRVAEGDAAGRRAAAARAIALARTLEHPQPALWAGRGRFFLGETRGHPRPLRPGGRPGPRHRRARPAPRVPGVPGRRSRWPPAATPPPRPAPRRGCAWPARPATTPASAGTSATLALRGRPAGPTRTPAGGHAAEAAGARGPRARGLQAAARPWPARPRCSTSVSGRPAEALARLAPAGRRLPAPAAPSSPSTPCPTSSRRPSAATSRSRRQPALAAFEQLATHTAPPRALARWPAAGACWRPARRPAATSRRRSALHDGQGRPFDLARTQLAYGEALRRARRRGDARTHLRGALEDLPAAGGGAVGRAGRGPSCGPPARRPAGATPAPSASSPPRSSDRPPGRRGGDQPRDRRPSSSSAGAPSTTTCATCS